MIIAPVLHFFSKFYKGHLMNNNWNNLRPPQYAQVAQEVDGTYKPTLPEAYLEKEKSNVAYDWTQDIMQYFEYYPNLRPQAEHILRRLHKSEASAKWFKKYCINTP